MPEGQNMDADPSGSNHPRLSDSDLLSSDDSGISVTAENEGETASQQANSNSSMDTGEHGYSENSDGVNKDQPTTQGFAGKSPLLPLPRFYVEDSQDQETQRPKIVNPNLFAVAFVPDTQIPDDHFTQQSQDEDDDPELAAKLRKLCKRTAKYERPADYVPSVFSDEYQRKRAERKAQAKAKAKEETSFVDPIDDLLDNWPENTRGRRSAKIRRAANAGTEAQDTVRNVSEKQNGVSNTTKDSAVSAASDVTEKPSPEIVREKLRKLRAERDLHDEKVKLFKKMASMEDEVIVDSNAQMHYAQSKRSEFFTRIERSEDEMFKSFLKDLIDDQDYIIDFHTKNIRAAESIREYFTQQADDTNKKFVEANDRYESYAWEIIKPW